MPPWQCHWFKAKLVKLTVFSDTFVADSEDPSVVGLFCCSSKVILGRDQKNKGISLHHLASNRKQTLNKHGRTKIYIINYKLI